MSKHMLRAINFFTVLLYIFSGIMILLIISYVYPRKIVEAGPVTTTKTSYEQGEEVYVTGHTTLYIRGTDTNDVRLQCGNSQYFVKQIGLSVKPESLDYNFSIGSIPYIVTPSPPKCKFVTITTYRVNYFLWFQREYQHVFITNEFNVREAEVVK